MMFIDVVVAIVTGEPVEQQLHGADVQVQLVHVMLAEVTNLQVPDDKLNQQQRNVNGCYEICSL